MVELAERCMADYDEDGWKDPAYRDGSDVSILGKLLSVIPGLVPGIHLSANLAIRCWLYFCNKCRDDTCATFTPCVAAASAR